MNHLLGASLRSHVASFVEHVDTLWIEIVIKMHSYSRKGELDPISWYNSGEIPEEHMRWEIAL